LASGTSDASATEDRVAVALDEAVERVVKRFEVLAREKQIALAWQCREDDRPIKVLATSDGVDRVLNNLVSNAIKYTPGGGRVWVTLRRAGFASLRPPAENAGAEEACLEVRDTGIGIPADALPHMFEEFYRAPNAKALVKDGTGLGMVITKDLVVRYGGRISVQSALGQGTTFTVLWPILEH
ncbi:MAG TPA: ATP-binding protein, partial [Candidatus Methylomirabilis sp.]|nr:ATP-binding protein [Candidatus Methylomirabilis sp.]